jgi:carboxymethylenebutenolidase
MCFDHDSHPPILPIAGGALDAGPLTMTSADGAVLNAFRARAAHPTGAGMVVLPDVRGLFPFYEELALRFAEQGIDAVAIDYFARTAGTDPRPPEFEFMPHVNETRFATLSADIAAAVAYLRTPDGGAAVSVFTVGFCFGGRLSFDAATIGLGLAGVIGFYGPPVGPGRNDNPAPAEVADRCGCPVLGLFGGADAGIPAESITTYDAALTGAGVEHRFVTYDGAPHSFFDRKATDYADASDAAWSEVLAFVRNHTGEAG